MKRLHALILFLLFGSGSVLFAQHQLGYNQPLLKELMAFTLMDITHSKSDGANLKLNNTAAPTLYPKMHNNENNLNFAIGNLAINANGEEKWERYLTWELGPKGDYQCRIPLSTHLPGSATYKIKLKTFALSSGNRATRIIHLYDTEKEDGIPVNLLNNEEGYSFNYTGEIATINDRFYLVLYGAEILKAGENLSWSDPSSWESGEVPDSETLVVIIPEGSSVVIAEDENFTIGYLENHGHVHNNGTLTVKEGVEMIP